MLVKDAMTTPAITVVSGAPLSDAISLLVVHKLSGLPVVDKQGKICGILSEGDLLRRIETGTTERAKHWWSGVFSRHNGAEAYRMTEGRRVNDVMTEPAITIEDTATLSFAASLMEKSGIKRIPVLRNGALVGMLTRADFVKVLRSFIAPAYEEPAISDADIKDKFHTELGHQRWAINCEVQMEVHGGHAKLTGAVQSEAHREAIRVAAENIVGVLDVVNNIEVFYPEVVPGF